MSSPFKRDNLFQKPSAFYTDEVSDKRSHQFSCPRKEKKRKFATIHQTKDVLYDEDTCTLKKLLVFYNKLQWW